MRPPTGNGLLRRSQVDLTAKGFAMSFYLWIMLVGILGLSNGFLLGLFMQGAIVDAPLDPPVGSKGKLRVVNLYPNEWRRL